SRAQAEDLKPGQLSSPVLSIQSPPALPDPTGIAAIINAVQNGNMFRDMSGLTRTAALAQAALQASAQGATAAGSQAAQTLATVMANNTERLRIAAQVATGGASGLGGGGGTGSRPAKNVTEEGARLNYARDMDGRASGGGASVSGNGAGSSRGSSARPVTSSSGALASSDEFAPSADVAGPEVSREDDLFNRQTGGVN